MSSNSALAISVGVLGAIAAYIFLGPLGGALQIWAAFIAWGCFFHCGGKEHGLQSTIICNVVGAVIAAIALYIATQTGVGASLGAPAWTGICLGVGLAIIVLLTNVPLLDSMSAQLYGFACVIALTLLANSAASLTEASMANPLIVVILSMIAGAVLGYISEKVAGLLASAGHHRAAAKA